jgi:hypothetical protein
MERQWPTRGRSRTRGVIGLAALVGFALYSNLALGQSAGGLEFADWTAVASNTATGTLHGQAISLSGSHVSDLPSSRVDSSSTVFASSDFTPSLATSDAIEFQGFTGYSYTLDLGGPTPNPVLHLGSLGSTIEFPSGTDITLVSGTFSVAGNTVVGNTVVGPHGLVDADGTVRLNGVFQKLEFTATQNAPYTNPDGIYIQVGADFTPPDTAITSGPPDGTIVGTTPPTFEFGSDDPDASFECRAYDPANPEPSDPKRHYESCTSPYQPSDQGVERGEQTLLEVRAIDSSGNADPTPAARQFVRDLPASAPSKVKCDPVPINKVIGRKVEGNCTITQIKHGKVPCLEVNTGKPAECRFRKATHVWLKSKTGHEFARVGDSIFKGKRKKRREFAIAAPIGDPRTSPCADTSKAKGQGKDSPGVARGTELAGACSVEIFGSYANANGGQMDNYATIPVCSSTQFIPYPYNDTASSVETPSPDPGHVWCYKGEGAGLNDVNGTERNVYNNYFTDPSHCHHAWSGGYETAAAKRPATLPYPARVDIHSPRLWRPVSGLRIAN